MSDAPALAPPARPTPYEIRTPRLLLRCWEPVDAPLLHEALAASADYIRPWMPWARDEPSPLEDVERRTAEFQRDFLAGRDFVTAMFTPDRSRVLGGTGLHLRGGEGTMEIGYWLRPDAVGQGLVTESSAALCRVAFALMGAARVEIRCDPRNERSLAVPRRLGFTPAAVIPVEGETTDPTRTETMVWAIERDSAAAAALPPVVLAVAGPDGEPLLGPAHGERPPA
jgi:RimJ/RimL family protein N-acetyltransferase